MTTRELASAWRRRRENPLFQGRWSWRRILYFALNAIVLLAICIWAGEAVFFQNGSWRVDEEILILPMLLCIPYGVLNSYLAFLLCRPRRFTSEQLEDLSLTMLSRREVAAGIIWQPLRDGLVGGLVHVPLIMALFGLSRNAREIALVAFACLAGAVLGPLAVTMRLYAAPRYPMIRAIVFLPAEVTLAYFQIIGLAIMPLVWFEAWIDTWEGVWLGLACLAMMAAILWLRWSRALDGIEHRLYADVDPDTWQREHWFADQISRREEPGLRAAALGVVRGRARLVVVWMLAVMACVLLLAAPLMADRVAWLLMGGRSWGLWTFVVLPVAIVLAFRNRPFPIPRGLMVAGLIRMVVLPMALALALVLIPPLFLQIDELPSEDFPEGLFLGASIVACAAAITLLLLPRRGRGWWLVLLVPVGIAISGYGWDEPFLLAVCIGALASLLFPGLAQRAHRLEFAHLDRWQLAEDAEAVAAGTRRPGGTG